MYLVNRRMRIIQLHLANSLHLHMYEYGQENVNTALYGYCREIDSWVYSTITPYLILCERENYKVNSF